MSPPLHCCIIRSRLETTTGLLVVLSSSMDTSNAVSVKNISKIKINNTQDKNLNSPPFLFL